MSQSADMAVIMNQDARMAVTVIQGTRASGNYDAGGAGMAEMMRLQVITPEREFYNGDVTMVELNTANGQMGIYPRHIPIAVSVAPGILKIHEEAGVRQAALLSGFIEVLPEKATILAEACEWPEEIDGARANEARVRAQRRLSAGNKEGLDVARAEMALKRALVRLSLTGEK